MAVKKAYGNIPGKRSETAKANASWNESRAALHRAVQAEKNAANTLSQAQAKFSENMLDAAAADMVVAAIQRLTEATITRKNAQGVFECRQQTLAIAQRNLDSDQQMDRVHVNEKAQQSYDAFLVKRAEARANEQAAREKGEPETVLPDQTAPGNVSNEGDERNPLAPGNGSGIMEEGAQGEDTGGVGGAEKPAGLDVEYLCEYTIPKSKSDEIIKTPKGSRPDPIT